MSKIGEPERTTQDRVINLLQNQLDYDYYGDWQKRENNSNVEEGYLRPWLQRQGYADKLINEALRILRETTEQKGKKLYYLNKDVYSLLRYGIEVKADIDQDHTTVHLIDWNQPERNDFAIAQEVSVQGANVKRPDIIFYINGIAVGVLELKSAKRHVDNGVRQNLDNQDSNFIQSFFGTMGLIMSGNDTQGIRYGTIETPAKHYLTWKEIKDPKYQHLRNPAIDKLYTDKSLLLDRHLCQLCHPDRLIEIMRDFTIFDGGKKKLCRHNQYFGLKSAQLYAQRRQGGIYWHTQGSGKSLSMVWFAKWILRNITDSRVLIITDRVSLDKQIKGVFKDAGEELYRTKSGIDLIKQLNKKDKSLIASLVHKFGKKTKSDEGDVEGYLAEIKRNLPKGFSPKGEIFVFIDECHRTQSGRLHKAMKAILGEDTTFFGFTGTPLLKKDKETSIELFGEYIHSYKFDEAVEDGVVLDLRYEARDINQIISDQQSIDEWFEAETRGLNEHAKTAIKVRWGTMQKVLSSKSRLEKIVNDIKKDFKIIPRLSKGQGNAMLVASSIYQACKYYELFQANGFRKCAIVTSYEPNVNDLKDESTGEDEETETKRQYEIYKRMLDGQKVEKFETEVKRMFIDEPGQMKLLIVVDKLLTGFDAPSATYLYIDKSMRDHGLFQAICRVNRLDGPTKEYGYIIDYKDLFRSIEGSIKDYTSEALGNYDEKDVAGLLKDRLETGKQKLDESFQVLTALCDPVPHPKDKQDYYSFFHDEDAKGEDLKQYELRRTVFYKFAVSFIRAFAAIANELEKAGYTKTEAATMKDASKFYTDLYREVRLYSGDAVDMKNFEPGMRELIDMYIEAEPSKLIDNMEDMSLVQLILKKGEDAIDDLPDAIKKSKEAVAETITSNIRSLITEESPTNPKYYEKLSILLQELVDLRKTKVIEYAEFLKRVIELAKAAAEPEKSKDYPETLTTGAQRSLYDNLEENEILAIAIDSIILKTKKHGWKGNVIKEKMVTNAIKKHIPAEKLDEIFQIILQQKDYD